MKKIISIALVAAAVSPVFAQEAAPAKEEAAPVREERVRSDVWPAFIAVCEFPDVTDVVGLRLTLPFSTRQENITGIESSICGGRSQMMFPLSSRSILSGFFPRETRVSMGSRSGSIGGFVTWEALIRSLSQ